VANYLHSTVDHQLNAADMGGWSVMDFSVFSRRWSERRRCPVPCLIATTVMWDRGCVRPLPIAAQTKQREKKRKLIGDIRAFGAVTPRENAFCAMSTSFQFSKAPLMSWELDPVASLYANTLNVPNETLRAWRHSCVTHSSLWFGIDYYGKFYVTKPATTSLNCNRTMAHGSRSTTARSSIDGVHPVAKQTAQTALSRMALDSCALFSRRQRLALVLSIQPPEKPMRVFNLNEFAAPAAQP